MAANSLTRRLIKRVLFPLVSRRGYSFLQAVAKARDIRSGAFTEPEVDLIPLAVRPGETVLDLGANFGLYSYHLDRAVGRSGRVYAFEPVPFTCEALRTVARLLRFRSVEIVPKGCGDRPGQVAFRVPLQESGALMTGQAYIVGRDDDRDGRETQVRWRSTTEVTCEVVALDEFLPEVADLSFIKCDVEGAEPFAFRGAERLIGRHRPNVLCEINPWFLKGFGLTTAELTDPFTARGYSIHAYDQAARKLRPVPSSERIVEDNYLLLSPERRDRFAPLL